MQTRGSQKPVLFIWLLMHIWVQARENNFYSHPHTSKLLDQWKPSLVRIITSVSSFKIVSSDAVHQPTWPLLLKIEHMVKLQVFGNKNTTTYDDENPVPGFGQLQQCGGMKVVNGN
jgi:hypothetical protein